RLDRIAPKLGDRSDPGFHRVSSGGSLSGSGRSLVAGETLEHVGGDRGDIVVVIVVREAPAPRDRARGKDRAASGGREIDDIPPHARVLPAAGARIVEINLFDHAQVVLAVSFG